MSLIGPRLSIPKATEHRWWGARHKPSLETVEGLAHLELHDHLVQGVVLHVDDAGLLDRELLRARALGERDLLLGSRVHVDLTGLVCIDVQGDRLTDLRLDTVAVRGDLAALDGDVDRRTAPVSAAGGAARV